MTYTIDPFLDGLAARMSGSPAPEPSLADLATAALAKVERIQAELDQATAYKQSIPYDQRNPRLLEQRKQASAREEQKKSELADATKAYNVANNNRASAEIQARFREQEAQRQEKRDTEQAQRAMVVESSYKERHLALYLANGLGTSADFEADWPRMWHSLRIRLAQEGVAEQSAALRADARYAF